MSLTPYQENQMHQKASEIVHLREQLAEAEERFKLLKKALYDLDEIEKNSYTESLKLTPQQKVMLTCLYKRQIGTKEALLAACYAHRPESNWPDTKILDVQMCKVRKVLPHGSIETVWGRGYKMTDIGRKFLKNLMDSQTS